MKKFFSRFVFRPKDLRENVEQEGNVHKAKIICFSLAMGLVAAGYQTYYDGLQYRSAQYQGKAYAGEVAFMDYDEYGIINNLWKLKNDLDVLEDKDFKDLVYLTQPDLKSTTYLTVGTLPPCEA